jgi:putative ABC transport system permease protein
MQSFADTLGQVYLAIMANKLRSFLTMFGIAWGVGSLLVLVGLGEGFRSGQRKNLASFGNDVVMMWNATIPALPNQHTGMRPYELTLGDEAAMRALPELRSVTGILGRWDLYEVSAWANTSGPTIGVEPNFSQVRVMPIADGRFFDAGDMADRRRVVVLGSKSATILFPGRPMLGESIIINDIRFTVVGRAAPISHGNNDSENQKLYVPLTTMQELFAMKGNNIPRDALQSLQYQPATKGEATAAVAAVHRVIGQRHGFDPGLKDAFQEWDTIKEEKMVGAIFDAMDVFLGGVGIVTLGLGAVGIINIMLVSVTERPAEGHRRHPAQHPGAVFLGGIATDRHQRLHRHYGLGGFHVVAAAGAHGQNARLRPAAHGSLVGGARLGMFGTERRRGRVVSGE